MGTNDSTKFSAEQSAVIVARDADACVLAPAGSGKTTTVAARVAYMIKKLGVAPAAIACVSYTDAAAETLKERIVHLVAEKCGTVLGLAELSVSTFHSLAIDLLRRHVPKYTTASMMPEAQRRLLAQKHFAEIGIGRVQRSVGRGKQARRVGLTNDPNDVRLFLKAIDMIREDNLDVRLLPSELRDAHQAYLALLSQNRCLDFAGVLTAFYDALCCTTDPDCLKLQEHVSNNLKQVIIDEFQDCAPLQSRTLRRLHNLGARLTAVGDPRQSIYGFRGGAPRAFSGFLQRYPDAGFYTLTKNRR